MTTMPTLHMQQNKHQEQKNPTFLHLQKPLRNESSTLRHNSKMSKPNTFGRKVKPTLYKNCKNINATDITLSDELDTCGTL